MFLSLREENPFKNHLHHIHSLKEVYLQYISIATISPKLWIIWQKIHIIRVESYVIEYFWLRYSNFLFSVPIQHEIFFLQIADILLSDFKIAHTLPSRHFSNKELWFNFFQYFSFYHSVKLLSRNKISHPLRIYTHFCDI